MDREHEDEEYFVMSRCKFVWEDFAGAKDIFEWKSNFKGIVADASVEGLVADNLLMNFIYYNERELGFLCKMAYSKFREDRIRELVLDNVSIDEAEESFRKGLERCRFTGLGRASESGDYFLYPFRQQNSLPVSLFVKDLDEIDASVEDLIIVDDFLATGESTIRFWDSNEFAELRKERPDLNSHLMVLVALDEGVSNVRQNTEMDVICPEILDEEYQAFSDSSSIFPEEGLRKTAKNICENYGASLEGSARALGFGGSELLVGFFHNVPDNTLPVIWSEKNDWYPLLRRKKKILSLRRRSASY
jgi:hypothetical protein